MKLQYGDQGHSYRGQSRSQLYYDGKGEGHIYRCQSRSQLYNSSKGEGHNYRVTMKVTAAGLIKVAATIWW